MAFPSREIARWQENCRSRKQRARVSCKNRARRDSVYVREPITARAAAANHAKPNAALCRIPKRLLAKKQDAKSIRPDRKIQSFRHARAAGMGPRFFRVSAKGKTLAPLFLLALCSTWYPVLLSKILSLRSLSFSLLSNA